MACSPHGGARVLEDARRPWGRRWKGRPVVSRPQYAVVALLALILCVTSSPAVWADDRQAPPPGQGTPPPPVDQAEAGDEPPTPLVIGPATLSASVWIDAIGAVDDDLNQTTNTFRLRRARVGLAGNLTPKIGWNISGELTAQPALRNAFLVVRFHEQLNLRVGQANPYTALERGSSTLQLEFIDRSPVTSELTGPLDVGLSVFNAKPYRGFLSYAVNLNNGSGFNAPDDNDAKDVSGRLVLLPPQVKGLTVLISGTRGEEPKGRRRRAGLGVEYSASRVRLMAERLRQERDGLPVSDGYFASAVYRFRPATATPHFRMFELAARWSVLHDPASVVAASGNLNDEGGAASDGVAVVSTTRELQAGANYYVNHSMRVMADIVLPIDDRPHAGPTLLTRLQVSF